MILIFGKFQMFQVEILICCCHSMKMDINSLILLFCQIIFVPSVGFSQSGGKSYQVSGLSSQGTCVDGTGCNRYLIDYSNIFGCKYQFATFLYWFFI